MFADDYIYICRGIGTICQQPQIYGYTFTVFNEPEPINFDETLRTLNMKTVTEYRNIICNLEILPQDKVYCLLGKS